MREDIKQAEDLGLIVAPSSEYPEWDLIWKEFNDHGKQWYELIKLEKLEEVKKRHEPH